MRGLPSLFSLVFLAVAAPSGDVFSMERDTHLVPMRDGIQLATDVYLPSTRVPAPTVLIRTPYGKGSLELAADIICDGLGYALVIQDTRGQGDSGGVDDTFLSDGWGDNQDGFDTIDWIISQVWSNGNVGMLGASALGITAYLAAGAFHPALKAAHVGIAPSTFYAQAAFHGGAFREAQVIDWLEDQGSLHMLPVFQEHPLQDDFWSSLDLSTRADELHTAIFHWGGWYDTFAEGPLSAFSRLQCGGPQGNTGPQQLLMGPWTHQDGGAWALRQGQLHYPVNSLLPLREINPFAWFDRFLLEDQALQSNQEQPPVRYYLMGDVHDPRAPGNTWESAQTWPIPAADLVLFLHPDGRLDTHAPLAPEASLSFIADPADPTPTIGGRELEAPSGPHDQTPLLSRGDVLVFESQPLPEPLKVVGPIRARFAIESDGPDTDLMVRLSDLYPDGRSMLLLDSAIKARYRNGTQSADFLVPEEIVWATVDLGSTAVVFNRGHRIQVLVSSSNHRRFQVGHNTDSGVFDEGVIPRVAKNRLHLGAGTGSTIHLPIPVAASDPAPVSRTSWSPADLSEAKARLELGQPLGRRERLALRNWAGSQVLSAILRHAQRR